MEKDFSVDELIKTVRITYEEFLYLKNSGYSFYTLKFLACKHLKCNMHDIDDIDFNYKLTFDVYLNKSINEVKNYE